MNPPDNSKRQAYRFQAQYERRIEVECLGCHGMFPLTEISDRGPARIRGGMRVNSNPPIRWDVDVHNLDKLCKGCLNRDVKAREEGGKRVRP